MPSASSAYYGGGYVVDLPKEGIIDGGVGGGGAGDDEGPQRLEGTVTTDSDTYGNADTVVVTVNFAAPAYYDIPFDQCVLFLDPVTGALIPPTSAGSNKTPVTLVGADAEGVLTVTPGRTYKFEMIFVPGFTGYVTPFFYTDVFTDAPAPDGKYYSKMVVKGDPFYVDMTVAAPPPEPPIPPPGTVPTTRYDETPGNETWVYWVEKRPLDSSPADWAYASSIELMVAGVSQPIASADRFTHAGELMKTESMGSIAGNMWRKVWYALSADVRTMTVGAGAGSRLVTYFEPEPPQNPGAPTPPPIAPSDGIITVTGRNTQPGIVSILMPFAAAGQYDIQITRVTEQSTKNNEVDKASWTKLNSRGSHMDNDPRTLLNLRKQHTLVEVQFRASENISGNVQQISAFVAGEIRPRLRRTDGSSYWGEPIVTRNPIWAVLDILTGYSIQNHQDVPVNKDFKGGWVKDDQIDFDSFIDLAAYCRQSIPFTNHDGRYASTIAPRHRHSACQRSADHRNGAVDPVAVPGAVDHRPAGQVLCHA